MVKHWITIGSFQKVIISLEKLDLNINLESWNTGKVMDRMLSFFTLTDEHAGHWLLRIYQPNFYFMFCSLQGQNQGFYLKEK